MVDARRPLHLGVFLGLSTCAYVVGLAGVTTLQAQSEAAVAADRDPTARAISDLATQNAQLERRAGQVSATYDQAMATYDRLGQTLADLEDRLGALATTVKKVDGAARALPARIALPPVTRSVTTVTSPTVHATTGGSGG